MANEEHMQMEDLKGALMGEFPKIVVRRANALKNIHIQYMEHYKQYQAEVRALEIKYQTTRYDPLFKKRASIVNGEYEPTEAESKAKDPEDEPTEENTDEEAKGIPEFWHTAMQNNKIISQSIFEQDEEALHHLTDITCLTTSAPNHGFTLSFHFSENPFFTDSVLTKSYELEEDDTYGELILQKAVGCKINWKAGKNLTVKVVTKNVGGGKRGGKGKKAGAARTVKTEEPQESFFSFFSPPQINPEADEEEQAEEDELLEGDFEIGCTFKDKIVPFGVLWFTGEAAEFEDDGFGDEFPEYDEEDDEEGDDEDDDEDEDDSEEDEPPKKGAKGPAKGPRGAAGHPFAAPAAGKGAPGVPPAQDECKNQ